MLERRRVKKDTHSTCFSIHPIVDTMEILNHNNDGPYRVKSLRSLKVGLYEQLISKGMIFDLSGYIKNGWIYRIDGHGHPVDAYKIGLDIEIKEKNNVS